MTTATATHEFIDVVDMHPDQGEYVDCKEWNDYKDIFGEAVRAYTYVHAERLVVNRKWGSRCECCNAPLRYVHVTQTADGVFHAFGRTCLDVTTLGKEGARRLALVERIEQKGSGGWCATFNVPARYWDIPREKRPPFARLWKAKGYGRNARQTWKLSVWGVSFADCQENCLDVERTTGVQLV